MSRLAVLTWSEHHFRTMGTSADVVVRGGPPALAAWAEVEAERLEGLWSRFRPGSDVTACNSADGRPVSVSRETIDLVDRAVEWWRRTDGRFDPTVLRALEANGYDESFERVRARADDAATRVVVSQPPVGPALRVTVPIDAHGTPEPTPGCTGIIIDHERAVLTLPRGVGMDLGGIGKGAAADRIAAGLIERGALGASVGLGGDVCCRGLGPVGGAWRIEVEDPFDEDRVVFAPLLRDAAIVTSTRMFRRWRHHGTWRHHIIDPATGQPAASGITAVVVIDDSTWRAEVLAKAALVAGRVEGHALLRQHRVAGWLFDDAGCSTATCPAAAEAPVG